LKRAFIKRLTGLWDETLYDEENDEATQAFASFKPNTDSTIKLE